MANEFSRTKSKRGFYSNLDELLHDGGERAIVARSGDSAYCSAYGPAVYLPTVGAGPTAGGYQSHITNHQAYPRSSSDSLLLDAFYENLLRKNALSSVSQQTNCDRSSPKLHFDVTKLATIGNCGDGDGDDGGAARCSTVTKSKRIDAKQTGSIIADRYLHTNKTGARQSNDFDSKKTTATVTGQGSDVSHKAGQGKRYSVDSKRFPVTRSMAKSPHPNSKHKTVKSDWSLSRIR